MELKDLVGEHVLTGVDSGILRADSEQFRHEDANTLLFILDGQTYLVTEDPVDGYRSSMRDIEKVADRAVANQFEPVRVIGRYLEKREDDYGSACDLLQLIDAETGKTVLEVGTDSSEDYYPSFVADFRPEHMASNQPVKADR